MAQEGKTSHGTGRRKESWYLKGRGKKRKERRARQIELHIPGP